LVKRAWWKQELPSCSYDGVKRLSFALVAALVSCRTEEKPAPKPSVEIAPAGMASAAKLVSTTNAIEVLTTLEHPREFIVSRDQLFAANIVSGGNEEELEIVSVALATGGSPKRLFRTHRDAEGLAFAGDRLFWMVPADYDADHDKRYPGKIMSGKPGSKATMVAKTAVIEPTSAASDGTDVFTFGDVKDGGAEVLRISGAKATPIAVAGPRLLRSIIAVNSTDVFWPQDGTIVHAPKSGGPPKVLVKLPGPNVQRLAADETAVYWTDRGVGDSTWNGRVYRATLADGAITTISDAPSPFGIAVDADTVYWTSRQTPQGRVLAQKKSGGATFVLAKDLREPTFIAVDAKYVYWTDTEDGSLSRAEKSPRLKP
jgi:hypothetical protein